MECTLTRFESNQKYGYELIIGPVKIFFDDSITGGKSNSLKCIKSYLINSPKLFTKREYLQTPEFKEFQESILSSDDIRNVELTKSTIRITSIISKMRVKNGDRESYWEINLVDSNNTQYSFDYDSDEFRSKQDVINDIKQKYDLTIIE